MAPTSGEQELTSVFEERAENLSPDELEAWSASTPRDEALLAKLKGPGSKLLSGPRGSGKSTLLKRAFYQLLQDQSALPIYVNYSRALALEPLFHTHANALQLFRQWVLQKILIGLDDTIRELKRPAPEELRSLTSYGRDFVRALEAGVPPNDVRVIVAPSELLSNLEEWAELLGFRRCVLLLDDAAHAFSSEQQQQFFEIFRELRSRRVAGKAAVYPGITSYSPFFHVGHEAEVLQAWYQPDDPAYLGVMREIVEKRLPERYRAAFQGREELIDYLALAAFGLPRGFLNMLSQVLKVDEDQGALPNRRDAEQAVADHAESVRRIFSALAVKLPRFRHFIEVGREFETAAIKILREFNRGREIGKKGVVIAIEEPLPPELDRILKFLEYAGAIRPVGSLSKGVKGVFQRFVLHYGIIISENALSLGRAFSIKDVVESLRVRDAHAFVRGKPSSYLGPDFQERCALDLPPCTRCGAQRVAAEQRFCMNCGAELTNVSVYAELLRAPIEKLPLTRTRINRIKEHSDISVVQDVLLDDELQALLNVPYIGPIWASRIKTYAEEFVSV